MQIIRGIHNLPPHYQCVATIGNFDGVHLGHQAVLHNVIQQAKNLNLPSVAITFEPQTNEYFTRTLAPARLTNLREKLAAMARTGIDGVLLLKFGTKLEAMPPQIFVERVLVRSLGVQFLFVGDDFRFGYRQLGDFQLLREVGIQYGFTVANMHTMRLIGERVSSTRIRNALKCGDLTTAARLLGRPYCLTGRVRHGAKRGRQLGFPTANLNLHRFVSPVRGVFAVRVFGIQGQTWFGVANIGQRPTIARDNEVLLEVHLFNFSGNLYRCHLIVELVHKLRDEQQFASLAELSRQIADDARQAQDLLLRNRFFPTTVLTIG